MKREVAIVGRKNVRLEI